MRNKRGKGQEKQSRRQFLWKLGMGIAGLAGLSKLAKTMAAAQELNPAAVAIVAIPVLPCVGGWSCSPPAYPAFHCPMLYDCIGGFDCGPSWLGDFQCQNGFDCQTPTGGVGQFKCIGSEPGTQFQCYNAFNCNGLNPFWCDPGDFHCNPGQYFCNGVPGGGYTQPITGCKPLL